MNGMDEVLRQARGFFPSRVILSACELDVFSNVYESPLTVEELAGRLDCEQRALRRVLDCLVTMELLEKDDAGRYLTSEKGGYMASSHPESVLPMVQHMMHLWDSWSHLTETVRLGENPYRKSLRDRGTDNLRAFIGAMHAVNRHMSKEIAADYDVSRFRCLLDVGGASGTYTMAFLRKNPNLTAVLFDLPEVIPMAEERLSAEGFMDRVALAPGDFYKDELPTGCDLALLSAIIHQNSPDQNLDLYRKVHRVLEPGGCILIRDHIMDESRLHPPFGAMFAINMLVNTEGGDTYTFNEVKENLEHAGFERVTLARSGERMDCLVEARKPE